MALIKSCLSSGAIDVSKIFTGIWDGTSANQTITTMATSKHFAGPNTTITFDTIVFTCVDAYQIKCDKAGKLYTSSLNGVSVPANTIFTRTGSEVSFVFIPD